MRPSRLICAGALTLVGAACGSGSGDSGTEPTVQRPTNMFPVGDVAVNLLGGQTTTATVRTVLASGAPAAGLEVNFQTADGGVSNTIGVTDAQGMTRTTWTPANRVGVSTLVASIAAANGAQLSVTFLATVTKSITGGYAGTATGTAAGLRLTLNLQHVIAQSTTVTGTGTLQLPGSSVVRTVGVIGSASGASFALNISANFPLPGEGVYSFSGTIQNNETMLVGLMNEPGDLFNVPLTLTKQ